MCVCNPFTKEIFFGPQSLQVQAKHILAFLNEWPEMLATWLIFLSLFVSLLHVYLNHFVAIDITVWTILCVVLSNVSDQSSCRLNLDPRVPRMI